MRKNKSGFTLVELLIVIVVIAILATVSVVAYSGIQQRAKVSAVQSDLRNIATQMELFKVDHGAYPSTTQAVKTDLEKILRSANLYETTRANQTDWNNGIYPPKRFVFCSPDGDGSAYAVVAAAPLLSTANPAPADGTITYAVDQTGTIKEVTYVRNEVSEASSLCTLATGIPIEEWNWQGNSGLPWNIWSNSVPSNWAP